MTGVAETKAKLYQNDQCEGHDQEPRPTNGGTTAVDVDEEGDDKAKAKALKGGRRGSNEESSEENAARRDDDLVLELFD